MTKILFVEDEDEYRELIGSFLIQEGFDVELAHNGAEGLAKYNCAKQANSTPFDLIITDSVMPMMTGMEFTARVRFENDTVPIFVMSGHEKTKEVAIKAGCTAFFLKPLQRRVLLEEIQNQLKRIGSD